MAIYFNVYICILYNDVMRCHKDTMMLRSTMGPYGRPVIEVAYGKMIFSLHRGYMGDVSSGESGWGVGMMHRSYLTYSGQHQCGLNVLFFGFQYIKPMYMYTVLKVYM